MKMSLKLILLFSLLAILTTAANTNYFYQARMEDLEERTYRNLVSLSEQVSTQLEREIEQMDFAIRALSSDVDFMSALYDASQMGGDDDLGRQLAAQNVLSRTLFQEPSLQNFYQVCVYCPNGFFLTNHFERTGFQISMSDEARQTIDTLPYLPEVNADPFALHIIGPHPDPWAASDGTIVFTVVRAVAWRGQAIGYIEINGHLDVLADIFMLHNTEGLMVQALYDDGSEFFRYMGDDVTYTNLQADSMTHVALEDGSERLVVGRRCADVGLNIFVSQDMSVYAQEANALLRRSLGASLSILAVTLALVALFSMGLTRSIRKLTRKVKYQTVDGFLPATDAPAPPAKQVVRPLDREIYHLEQVYDEMLERLRASMRNEMALREGALQAQLSALQMQINPHFIYNTLNIISAKGLEVGSMEVSDLCDQFAQMLRYATDLRSRTATLADEVENARRYLTLVKARFEALLEYTIDLPEEAYGLLIPKLTLQPLVENALTHGFAGRNDRREIALTGVLEGNTLVLTIRDNGNGFEREMLNQLRTAFRSIEEGGAHRPDALSGHLGLTNTYLRLYNYSRGAMRMRLYNDCGAVVELTLPRRQQQEDE